MKIDLDDKLIRFLVQEYVNKIYDSSFENELKWNMFKLIHTFQVVEMAEKLIKNASSSLSKEMKKHIWDAALLHDLGRCHEFKNGKRLKIDHGEVGAKLIRKNFPELEIEAQSTLFHNKIPSDKDPKSCQPVLDYVRDADMLANLKHQIDETDIWLNCILDPKNKSLVTPVVDPEIFDAAKEHRMVRYKKVKIHNLLTLWSYQMGWYYNLRTPAGKMYAQKNKVFVRLKQTIIDKIVPLTTKDKKKQKQLAEKIEETFPNKLFLK